MSTTSGLLPKVTEDSTITALASNRNDKIIYAKGNTIIIKGINSMETILQVEQVITAEGDDIRK